MKRQPDAPKGKVRYLGWVVRRRFSGEISKAEFNRLVHDIMGGADADMDRISEHNANRASSGKDHDPSGREAGAVAGSCCGDLFELNGDRQEGGRYEAPHA